jgi:hypothetical protein
MRTSDQINELAAALAAAQGEMQNAAMSAENPHFKSKYADLAAIRNATIPSLSKHGLSILQATWVGSTEMLLTTRLMHSSGQWIEAEYPIVFNERPHVMGSAITYAKRYSWSAITGIAAEVDDDGNEANDAAKNGSTLPSLPKRKSSAQAKRDGDWPKLEQALADCQSAREVERLREEWVRDWYPSWKDDWRDSATEAFDKRLAEFSQPGALKQTLQDSLQDPEQRGKLRAALSHPPEATDEQVTKYHECWEWLEGAQTLNELVMRTDNPGFKEGLKTLTKLQVAQLREYKAARMEVLSAEQAK